MKNKKALIITACGLLVIALIVTSIIIIIPSKNQSTDNNSTNKNIVNTKESYSFNYMILNKDNMNLTDNQKLVLDYFDYSYQYYSNMDDETINRYPSLFKNLKICIWGKIAKILKSDDNFYSALLEVLADAGGPVYVSSVVNITGQQQTNRFVVGDYVTIYGNYDTSVQQEYEGTTKTMAKINVTKWYVDQNKFSNDQLRIIAKTIFGDNIKFGEIEGCAYNPYCEGYPVRDGQAFGLKVKLEDPKNSNYTEFNIFRSGSIFEVGYCNPDNYIRKCSDGLPQMYVAADFQHFIVITYETATETAYLEYYDTSFNKIWRKEVDKVGSQDSAYKGYLDYNDKAIILIMDGYLHYIDINNGNNIIEPLLIGKDHKVTMFKKYVMLTGIDKKDFIEIMDYDGKIIKKYDLKSTNIDSITTTSTQMIDGKITIIVSGYDKEYNHYTRVIRLDDNLDIIYESDDVR